MRKSLFLFFAATFLLKHRPINEYQETILRIYADPES
jgi:hypothetical protein